MQVVIWDKPGSPPAWVTRQLGLADWQLTRRLHTLKGDAGPGGADRVSILSDGTVLGPADEDIGNLYDEYD
jgi:hypothetical protein